MHNIAFFKIFFAIDFYEEFLIKKISILFNDKPVLKTLLPHVLNGWSWANTSKYPYRLFIIPCLNVELRAPSNPY